MEQLSLKVKDQPYWKKYFENSLLRLLEDEMIFWVFIIV